MRVLGWVELPDDRVCTPRWQTSQSALGETTSEGELGIERAPDGRASAQRASCADCHPLCVHGVPGLKQTEVHPTRRRSR